MTVSVEPWLAAPLARFVTEARVRLAIVLETNGRVLAQHGFSRSLDVMSACALAAALHATATELGTQLEGVPFGALHHVGRSQQIFLATLSLAPRALLLLAVFEESSSLGLVRLFSAELRQCAGAAVAEPAPRGEALAADFEVELNRNLAALFGRT